MHLISALAFHSITDLAKQYDPIMRLKLGEVDTIVVSSGELSCEMLKQHDPCYADRPNSIGIKPPKRLLLRLHPQRRAAADGAPVNIRDAIFSMMSSVTCRAAFGKVSKDKDTLIKILRDGIQMVGGFEIAYFFLSSFVINTFSWTKIRLLMMRHKLDVILDELIRQHQRNLAKIDSGSEDGERGRKGNDDFGNEDIVDVLLRLQETGELQFPIRKEDIKAVVYDMFCAGTETSSTAMDWAMAELMRNPRVIAKVQAEVRQGSTEDARSGSNPATSITRRARDRRVRNPSKREGSRDPQYWTNPDSFEPERFEECSKEFVGADFDYLPFGAGKRMCPGITFAMASVELVLAQLLYHFDWKLPNGAQPESMDMIENPGVTASRRDSLTASRPNLKHQIFYL
ncbi:hypothetical protein SASPL_151030 [Salvia splendens]|uniref:Uncharacterized protein n=1 Tax=Salvia splendens TaxID=180675 RepID=A0A8X8W8J5_SALSN|nr:hypothetical protein SASPL_151022 [Salvia splendens]KAG6389559.1 hypothetical protein SASPL_151030 [Salvia splendens]